MGRTASDSNSLQISPIKAPKGGIVSPSPSPTSKIHETAAVTAKKKTTTSAASKRKSGIATSSSSGKKEIKSCRCVKSKCLKLYCECFSSGVLCGPHCKCVNCNNNKTELNGKIKSAKESYLIKKPSAFTKPPKVPGQSCACRTNR